MNNPIGSVCMPYIYIYIHIWFAIYHQYTPVMLASIYQTYGSVMGVGHCSGDDGGFRCCFHDVAIPKSSAANRPMPAPGMVERPTATPALRETKEERYKHIEFIHYISMWLVKNIVKTRTNRPKHRIYKHSGWLKHVKNPKFF